MIVHYLMILMERIYTLTLYKFDNTIKIV